MSQLCREAENALQCPPSLQGPAPDIPVSDFAPEEDVCLLKFICSQADAGYFEKYCHMLNPGRSRREILARIEELRSQRASEKIAVIDQFASEIAREENGLSRETELQDVDALEREIEELARVCGRLGEGTFQASDLGLFVNEGIRVAMRKKRVTIGFGNDSKRFDVDLVYFDRQAHVARRIGIEAAVEFKDDGVFYVTNRGIEWIAVNGTML
jgi:hypothetical protein